MHASRVPHPMDYVLLILTKKTSWSSTVIEHMNLTTVIEHMNLLSVQDICPTYVLKRGIPEDSLKPNDITMSTWHLFT